MEAIGRLHVTVRRTLVDARYLENSIPATHRRTFEVDASRRARSPTSLHRR